VHPSPIFWPIYNILIRLIKKKLRNRIHMHYTLDSLHKHFPKKNLPVSLGGELDDPEITDTELVTEMLRKNIRYEGMKSHTYTYTYPMKIMSVDCSNYN